MEQPIRTNATIKGKKLAISVDKETTAIDRAVEVTFRIEPHQCAELTYRDEFRDALAHLDYMLTRFAGGDVVLSIERAPGELWARSAKPAGEQQAVAPIKVEIVPPPAPVPTASEIAADVVAKIPQAAKPAKARPLKTSTGKPIEHVEPTPPPAEPEPEVDDGSAPLLLWTQVEDIAGVPFFEAPAKHIDATWRVKQARNGDWYEAHDAELLDDPRKALWFADLPSAYLAIDRKQRDLMAEPAEEALPF